MISLLEFVELKRKKDDFNKTYNISEAFRFEDMPRVTELITSYLQKKLDHLYMIQTPEIYVAGRQELTGFRWINIKTGANVRIGWKQNVSGAANAYSVDFFKDAREFMTGTGSTDLTVYTNGASVALVLPLIVEIMSTGRYNADSALVRKLATAAVKETFVLGSVKYTLVSEDAKTELIKKKKSLQSQKSTKSSMGDYDAVERISSDIERINAALLSDEPAVMEETLLSFQKNVATATKMSPSMARAAAMADDIESNPKTAFKIMEKYLVLALKGDRNIVLICGAPGVGKTYRVKKFLNELVNDATGGNYIWADDIDGVNGDIFLIKGRASGAMLYRYLWRSRNNNQILFIDDADSILEDENAINLLKAAGEGGKNRTVTWAVAGKVTDLDPDDPDSKQIELPKSFKYNGKIIILTNYRAGMIDTAIRSRAYIQDINFSVQSVLAIIKDVMPTMNEPGLTAQGKKEAYEYLCRLAEEGSPMEISLRTFGSCAAIFSVVGSNDPTEKELVMEMVKEQMRLQSLQGGKKY